MVYWFWSDLEHKLSGCGGLWLDPVYITCTQHTLLKSLIETEFWNGLHAKSANYSTRMDFGQEIYEVQMAWAHLFVYWN